MYTCRQINAETRGVCLNRVLFDFNSPATLMDKLSSLSTPILSQIRHVRVLGDDVALHCTPIESPFATLRSADKQQTFSLVALLRLLPALQLDTLTVLIRSTQFSITRTVGSMIRGGNGWKELRVLSQGSFCLLPLTPDIPDEPFEIGRAPAHWQSGLYSRDGRNSGASVTAYVSTVHEKTRSACNPSTRQAVNEHNILSLKDRSWHCKESLVIVRRGRNADITKLGPTPFPTLHSEWMTIQYWDFGNTTWADIKNFYIEPEPTPNEWLRDMAAMNLQDQGVEYDEYKDAEEFEWEAKWQSEMDK
jgi:hypothetical protein